MHPKSKGEKRVGYAGLYCVLVIILLAVSGSAMVPSISIGGVGEQSGTHQYDLFNGLPVLLTVTHDGQSEEHFVSRVDVYLNGTFYRGLNLSQASLFDLEFPSKSLLTFTAYCNVHGASDNISLETGKFLKNSRQVRVTVNVGGSFSQEKLDSVKDEIKVRQTEFSTTTVFPQTIRAPEGGEKPSKKPLLNNAIILFVVAIALIIAYWKTKKPAGKDK